MAQSWPNKKLKKNFGLHNSLLMRVRMLRVIKLFSTPTVSLYLHRWPSLWSNTQEKSNQHIYKTKIIYFVNLHSWLAFQHFLFLLWFYTVYQCKITNTVVGLESQKNYERNAGICYNVNKKNARFYIKKIFKVFKIICTLVLPLRVAVNRPSNRLKPQSGLSAVSRDGSASTSLKK